MTPIVQLMLLQSLYLVLVNFQLLLMALKRQKVNQDKRHSKSWTSNLLSYLQVENLNFHQAE